MDTVEDSDGEAAVEGHTLNMALACHIECAALPFCGTLMDLDVLKQDTGRQRRVDVASL